MLKYETAYYEKSFGTASQLPVSDMPEIAFAGKSNVGKSSLLNKILNRKNIARVSATPGKTVTVNFFRLNECRFADLPGYGYAKVSNSEKLRWAELMEAYFTTGRQIKLVVQLLDMRHLPTQKDIEMLEFLASSGYDFILVLTKSDKLNKTEKAQMLEKLTEIGAGYSPAGIYTFSALKNEGTGEIKAAIEKALEGKD